MNNIYNWLKSGFSIIPNVFLKEVGNLGLSSEQVVLILYFFQNIETDLKLEELQEIQSILNWDDELFYNTLHSLLEKGYLTLDLVTTSNGKKTDVYSLEPLIKMLSGEEEVEYQEVRTGELSPKELVALIEKEFGRALSNLELETIGNWLNVDNYSTSLIRLAVREASIRNVSNINYIDRILLNWQKAGIHTAEDAQRQIDEFAKKTAKKTNKQELDSRFEDVEIPLYDFGKGE